MLEAGADPERKDNHGLSVIDLWFDDRKADKFFKEPDMRKAADMLVERGFLELTPDGVYVKKARKGKAPPTPKAR